MLFVLQHTKPRYTRMSCEIDIMEKPWLDERVQHTFHWDGYGNDHKSEGHAAKVPGVMDGGKQVAAVA